MPDLVATPLPLRGRRILVVEDEWFTAEDVRERLAELGAEVVGPVPSVDGALAVVGAAGTPPLDAAVLDVNLGGELVYPVADALLGLGVPFIFATGYDAGTIPAAYARLPRCEKPFDVRRCLALLSEMEGRSH